jgi:poly-gamma-glutamate system protein
MMRYFFNPKKLVPKEGEVRDQKDILILLLASLLFFAAVKVIPFPGMKGMKLEMLEASRIMVGAMNALKECQNEEGIPSDTENDPNQTGLIGLKDSPLTTSLGHLEAKRTTTNPNTAALAVYLLTEAGVKTGDTIAVGASSSFPALIVAVLSAAEAMGLRPLVMSSLGASQWGANRLDFSWLYMQECLEKAGIFSHEPVAVSLGGDRDRGEEMQKEVRSLLRLDIERRGIVFLDEPDLTENVNLRMTLYEDKSRGEPIKAFINIGGSWSNIGTDASVLNLRPGLVQGKRLPIPEDGGVIHRMAAKRIPVIHLLNIRGLTNRYDLPWDPVPLPPPGKGRIYHQTREKNPLFLILCGVYLLFVVFFLIWRGMAKK